jgi:hypothetical protein
MRTPSSRPRLGSPILVEEARFGDVVLMQDREFYSPAGQDSNRIEEINTALLTRYGAEMVFARSVMLVEGEADREFFDNLHRRLAPFDSSGRIDQVAVIPTGSRSYFGPWIRLLRSYGEPSRPPIRWIALVDGDSPSEIRRGFLDAGAPLRRLVVDALDALVVANTTDDLVAPITAARNVNRLTLATRTPLMVAPGDLEWASLNALADADAVALAARMGVTYADTTDLVRRLGSKHVLHPASDPLKHPWRRAFLAREMDWEAIAPDAVSILRRWLASVMPQKALAALFAALRADAA